MVEAIFDLIFMLAVIVYMLATNVRLSRLEKKTVELDGGLIKQADLSVTAGKQRMQLLEMIVNLTLLMKPEPKKEKNDAASLDNSKLG